MISKSAFSTLIVLVLATATATLGTSQPKSTVNNGSVMGAPTLTWLSSDAEFQLGAVSGLDLSALTAREWDDFRTREVRRLRSSDEDARAEALQNIIYAAFYYPNEVHLNRSTMSLLDVYKFDGSERNRIMALVALRAIGKDASMRNLAAHIQWEKSARVRKLTKAAVQDYYSSKPE